MNCGRAFLFLLLILFTSCKSENESKDASVSELPPSADGYFFLVSGPARGSRATCLGPYRIEDAKDAATGRYVRELPTLKLSLSDGGNGGTFYSDSACTSSISEIQSSPEADIRFYYSTNVLKHGISISASDGVANASTGAQLLSIGYAGTADTSFGTAGSALLAVDNFYDQISDLAVLGDGSILAAGYSQNDGQFDFVVAKFTRMGQLDLGFGAQGTRQIDLDTRDDVARAILVDENHLYLVGYANRMSGSDFAVVRLNLNGSIDTTFGVAGKLMVDLGGDDYAHAIAKVAGGYVVVGYSLQGGDSDSALMKFDSSGTLVSGFGTQGKVVVAASVEANDKFVSVAMMEGRIIAGGIVSSNGNSNSLIAKFSENGSLDTSFGQNGLVLSDLGRGANDSISSIAIGPGSHIYAAGFISDASGSDFLVACFTPTGQLQTAYGEQGIRKLPVGSSNDEASKILVLDDGSALVAGESWSGTARKYDLAIVALDPKGRTDEGFGTSGVLLADGGGAFDHASAFSMHTGGFIVGGSRISGMDARGDSQGSQFDFAISRFR